MTIYEGVRILDPLSQDASAPERWGVARFGIFEGLAAAVASVFTSIGVGATTAGVLGDIGAGAISGGVIGAATDPRQPLKGAEFGALTGGIGAAAAPIIGLAGLGTTATDALSGAAGGAGAAAITGRNIGTSALEGGIAGGIAGAFSPSPTPTPVGTATGGPTAAGSVPIGGGAGGSAVATAAPSSVSAAPLSDTGVSITPSGSTATTGGGITGGSATGATAAAPAAASSGGGITDFLKSNASLIGPIGGLAYEALAGKPKIPFEGQLKSQAASLASGATKLESYYQTGTLPPGIQTGLTAASDAAKATIRSQYAAIGDSGSSAEAQDIAAVDQRMVSEGANVALGLLQQGISEQGMANQLYLTLMGQALQQDQQLGSAIANFSASLVHVPGSTGATG